MALPELNVGIKYRIKLPVSGNEMEVRPYLVKDEKILLIAMESDDLSEIINAVRTVLKNCTGEQNIDNLSWIDIEYLLLKIKSFSAGEVVDLHVKCHNLIKKSIIDGLTGEPTKEFKEVKCGVVTDIPVDLSKEIIVDTSKIKDNKVQLTDTIYMVLRPPRFKLIDKMLTRDAEADMSWDAMAECIDYVVVDDEIIRDYSAEEVENFLGNFNTKQLQLLRDYVDSLPKIHILKHFKCSGCGYEQDMELKNFKDFFPG